MPVITREIETRTKEYKVDIGKLEDLVKQSEDVRIKKISELADDCYKTFNDLQMSIAKIDDSDKKQEYDLKCYEETYNFLVFIENKVDPDFYVYISIKSKSFSDLISHYSLYCTRIEEKHDIELESEKLLRNGASPTHKTRTVRKK